MAVDYATLKKGGFMRQKQKNNFSLRLAVVGGNLTAENLKELLTFANAAASLITTRKGALRVMPAKEEVLDFIKSRNA